MFVKSAVSPLMLKRLEGRLGPDQPKNRIDWNKRATAISHNLELNQIGYYDISLEELLRFFSMHYWLNKIWNWIIGEFVQQKQKN